MRRLLLLAFGLVLYTIAPAQETVTFWEPEKAYKEALELFDHADYVNAREAFREVILQARTTTDPDIKAIRVNSEFYLALSALTLQNPDGEHLMLSFLNNHTGNANSNRAYFHLGDFYYRKKQYREVVNYHERVDPFELSRTEKEDYKFQLAYGYFFEKEFTPAKRLFKEVINTERYYYPAHYYHGFIAFVEKDYDTALDNFQKVQASTYFGRVVPYYIASIYYQQGNYRSLTEYATPLLEDRKIKYYPEINQLVGKAYFEQGNYEKALPLLMYYAESTRRMSKEDIYQLGYTQYQLKEYEEAIGNFEQLTREKDSVGQHAVYLLGDSYLHTGDLNKARRAFQEAAEMPYDPFVQENALFNYAKTSYEAGVHNAAITATQAFLNQFPNSANSQAAKELLTDMFLNTRNYREAIKIIESMSSQSPTIKEAYQKVTFFRGVELYNDKRFKEAVVHFNKSLAEPIDEGISAQSHFWKAEISLQGDDYFGAISEYRKFKTIANVAKNLPLTTTLAAADYGIGYAYFEQEDYQSAERYFSDAKGGLQRYPNAAAGAQLKKRLLPDATLRLADCQFMLKRYDQALANYQDISNEKAPDSDYALYQQGMIQGVNGNIAGKRKAMTQVIRNFPGSFYYDDALYQLASAHLLEKNNTDAILVFNQLIDEEPKSPYVLQSLMKVALIYFNMRQDQKAIEYYSRVAENYPGTAEAGEALAQVKRISVELGDPSIYINLAGANVSEQDTLQFRTAENFYFQEKYDRALEELTQYINEFPTGYFNVVAHYYRADCYYREKDYTNALPDYEYVIQANNNQPFAEVSYLRAAKICHFILEDYDKAFRYYEPLLELASLQQTKFEVLQALMNLGFATERYRKAEEYAKRMLEAPQASDEDLINAHYYLAKVNYERGIYDEAMTQFTQVSELTDNAKGVEARYFMADIHFMRGDFTLAEAQCDDIIRNYPSYELWLVKSLILVSDVYYEQGEYFQAKATLKSIVDSYQGDPDILQDARDKLARVEAAMDENSRIKGPEDDPFNNPEEPDNNNRLR